MKRLEDQPNKWRIVTSVTMNENTVSIFRSIEDDTYAVEVFEIDEVKDCAKKLSAESAMKKFSDYIQGAWDEIVTLG